MTSGTTDRQPALDGLRGLSIALVLLFHGGWSWMSGGYLGVSVFFTLSGFLITRLLLREHAATGRIGLGRFWIRRVRRLLPASLVCLTGVMLLRAAGAYDETPHLGRDVLGAIAQVANWVELWGTTTYAEQVAGARGPLDHFWSLSIEEQFYWGWPLLMVAALRAHSARRTVLLTAFVSVLAAPAIAAVWGNDAAYWATPARIGEIAIGGALAVVVRRRGGQVPEGFRWLGPIALAAIVACAVTWPSDHGPAYEGWLPVFAIGSACVVAALQLPGRMQRLFAWRPLVALGGISYGVYLYHWPIFVLFGSRSQPRVTTFAVQVAATLLVAGASSRWVELPIRRGRVRLRRDWPVAGLATGGAVCLALVLPLSSVDPFAHPELAAGQLEPASDLGPLENAVEATAPPATEADTTPATTTPAATTPAATTPADTTPADTTPADTAASVTAPPTSLDPATAPPTTAPPTTVAGTVGDLALPPPPGRPVRILIVGDSVMWSIGNGLVAWAYANPNYAAVGQSIAISCGFVRAGAVPAFEGLGYEAGCDEMLDVRLPAKIEELQPDVVVLMSTRTDVADRVWNADEGALPATDHRFHARQIDEYTAFTGWLLDRGVPNVVWIKPPVVRGEELAGEPMTDPAAMAAVHAAIDATVAGFPDSVSAVDLAGWYPTSGMDDADSRPDGLHFLADPAFEVADRFLAPSLIAIALGPPA